LHAAVHLAQIHAGRVRVQVDAQLAHPVQPRARSRRSEERLRRHAVVEHARPAEAVPLDHRDISPQLRGHQCGLVACRPSAHDHDGRHQVASSPLRLASEVTISGVPLYAAYGSNMDPAQVMERAPHSPMAGTGWIEGWRLTFGGEDLGWEGALATIVPDPDSRVFVVLYDVCETDERQLDSWEGGELGLHTKIRLRVQTLDGPVLAWLYVLD